LPSVLGPRSPKLMAKRTVALANQPRRATPASFSSTRSLQDELSIQLQCLADAADRAALQAAQGARLAVAAANELQRVRLEIRAATALRSAA